MCQIIGYFIETYVFDCGMIVFVMICDFFQTLSNLFNLIDLDLMILLIFMEFIEFNKLISYLIVEIFPENIVYDDYNLPNIFKIPYLLVIFDVNIS